MPGLWTFLKHEGVELTNNGSERALRHAVIWRKLGLCRAAAIRGGWKANLFNPWEDYLPRPEQQMDSTEAAVSEIDSVDAALQLVVQVESSEINQVLYAALAATDPALVKKLRPFREAMEAHMAYLVERLPELSPEMQLACRKLRARFPGVRR